MDKKNKDQKNKYEMLYGAHSLIEFLKAKKRKLYSIYTSKPLPKAWHRIEKYLPTSIPNIQYVSRDVLDRMAGTQDHMGIVALVAPFQFKSKSFDSKQKSFVLLLDAIQDVRNLGAILRSAYCTGVDGVVLCKKGGAPLTAAAHKASAGLAEHMDIHIAPSMESAILELKKSGYHMYMSVVENGKNAAKINYEFPLCLVIGNEEIGISKNVQKSGELITLPQRSSDISYNASVAAGILLFLISQAKK
jgi:23S rRNA (guanosine2251-2'-O)-methyltransferase